jgi:ribonucleoside-diphosphate reductase alpha chain
VKPDEQNPVIDDPTQPNLAEVARDAGGAPAAPSNAAPVNAPLAAAAAPLPSPAAARPSEASAAVAGYGAEHDPLALQLEEMMGDAPVCDGCGHITVRNGACYKCLNCGNSMGCS